MSATERTVQDRRRTAVTQMQGIIIVVVVIIAAVGLGAYFLTQGKSPSGAPKSSTVDLVLVESNPVLQNDSFDPANVTATHDTTLTLVVQNGDDEARVFEINAFNVNETIGSGITERITINLGQPGTFQMYVPPAPPYNGFKASPAVIGYLIVD
jgi:Cupredoxin-like domain